MSFPNLREWCGKTGMTWRSEERRKHQRRPLSGRGTMSWIDDDELAWCVEVEFADASGGGVAVRAPEAVPRGQTVWLLLQNGAAYCGLVCHIREEADGYVMGLKVVPDRNALTPWRSDRESVQMKWLDPEGHLRNSTVRVQRKGVRDVRVTAPRAVPAPGVVMMWDDEAICFGATRECEKDGRQYSVEIELLGDSYRNKLSGQPA